MDTTPMICSPPGSSVHETLQARIPEWVAIPFSKGSSWPRYWIQVSCIAGIFFTNWATREVYLKMDTIILQHWRISQVLFYIYIADLPLIYIFLHYTNPSSVSPESLGILLECTDCMKNLHKNFHYRVNSKSMISYYLTALGIPSHLYLLHIYRI